MGMPGPVSRSSYDRGGCNGTCAASVAIRSNPVPSKYQIVSETRVNDFLILDLKYDNCTNYEGHKILMFDRGIKLERLKRQGGIDPHFFPSETKIHPIARFEPTPRGHAMAVALAQGMRKHER